jgi:hypothetical protein
MKLLTKVTFTVFAAITTYLFLTICYKLLLTVSCVLYE